MLTMSDLAICVFGIVSKTVIHMVAALCHVQVVGLASCLWWRHSLFGLSAETHYDRHEQSQD